MICTYFDTIIYVCTTITYNHGRLNITHVVDVSINKVIDFINEKKFRYVHKVYACDITYIEQIDWLVFHCFIEL